MRTAEIEALHNHAKRLYVAGVMEREKFFEVTGWLSRAACYDLDGDAANVSLFVGKVAYALEVARAKH